VKDAWFPTNRFKLMADSVTVFSNGTLSLKDSANWTPAVRWQIRRQVLLKNHLMVLDLLANNNWERPIYFAVTTGPDSYIDLQDHFQLEGLTYRVVPVNSPNKNPNLQGRVAADLMFENVTTKFLWGNMDSEKPVYLDENILRMTTNLRLQLSSLAEALIEEGKTDKARTILDLSLAKMPEHNVPFDRILLPTVEAYYAIGDKEKGNQLSERLFSIMEENLTYYMSLETKFASRLDSEMAISHAVMGRLMTNTDKEDPAAGKLLRERFERIDEVYQGKLLELQAEGRRTSRMKF
jgi:hypothetical protein